MEELALMQRRLTARNVDCMTPARAVCRETTWMQIHESEEGVPRNTWHVIPDDRVKLVPERGLRQRYRRALRPRVPSPLHFGLLERYSFCVLCLHT